MNLITGYYGFRNFGDDLFKDIMIDYCDKNNIYYNIEDATEHSTSRVLSRLKLLNNNTSLTLAGGSILGSNSKFGIRNLERCMHSISGFKYCALGVGLYNSKKLNPSFIKSMDFIGTRSFKDFQLLSEISNRVSYSSDLAYLIDVDNQLHSNNNIGIVVANIGDFSKKLLSKDNLNLLSLLNNLNIFYQEKIKINLYIFQSIIDKDVAIAMRLYQEIIKLGVPCEIYIHKKSDETIAHLNTNTFIISDRLHGAIVSHKLNIPFILSLHHEKCIDFLNDICYNQVLDLKGNVTPKSIESAYNYSNSLGIEKNREMTDYAVEGINSWRNYIVE